MLCREIIAVRSEIHTKHINKLCGQNVELLNLILAAHFKHLKKNALNEILELLNSIFLQKFASNVLNEKKFNDV